MLRYLFNAVLVYSVHIELTTVVSVPCRWGDLFNISMLLAGRVVLVGGVMIRVSGPTSNQLVYLSLCNLFASHNCVPLGSPRLRVLMGTILVKEI